MARKTAVLLFCVFALMAGTFFSGCASTGALEEVRAIAEEAKSKANAADKDAERAYNRSGIAIRDAQEHSEAAEQAARDAQAAADRAEAAAEKSERIFDKISGK